MKKFLLLTIGLGIFAVSCGTKEPQMSSDNTDSTAVQTPVPPVATDTVTAPTTSPDTIRAKVDSAASPAIK